MAEVHFLTAEEARAIFREELRSFAEELRGACIEKVERLSTAQVAEELHVTRGTVREWIKTGKLPASKPKGARDYTVKRTDLESWRR